MFAHKEKLLNKRIVMVHKDKVCQGTVLLIQHQGVMITENNN